MDLKTFAEEDFDPKKWINRAWSGGGNQEKEIFVANTVARLQLYMKQLSNSLDETATQIVSSVPRTVADASALQLEAARLQQRLVTLEQTVQGVEEQTGHSIKSLQKIDHLKSRLENAASALKEADKWVALAQSLEDTLDSGVPTQRDKLSALAEQVEAMTASLEVLSDSPEYETKRIQLATLYNRLEAAISPPFIEALTQMDAERTSSYVSVFRGMSREAGALRCWRRAAAAARAARWARVTSHTPRAATHLLLDDAHAQVEWLSTVLRCEAPLSELLRLLTDLLLSLDPSLTKIVTANFKLCQSPEEGITYLADLRRDLDEFAAGVRAVLESPKYNKERVSEAVLRALWCALYGPLRALLPRYTELQTALLAATLQRHGLGSDDLLEHARAVLVVCERAGGWLASAYNTGHGIAGDAIQTYHAPAVETFVQSLLSLITSHTRRVEASFLSSCRSPRGGSTLDAFPAALALERAAGVLREGAGGAGAGDGEDAGGDSDDLTSHSVVVSRALMPASSAAPTPGPPPSTAGLQRAGDALKALARNILRHPIDVQLDKIPQLSAWSDNDSLVTELPDFALSPQEYITEVGQYLMTLPQHLELHLGDARAPWRLLTELCAHACEVYTQKILSIRNMDALGTKRCLTDIVYLSSVVEDLGSSITPALKNLEKSLRAATPAQSE